MAHLDTLSAQPPLTAWKAARTPDHLTWIGAGAAVGLAALVGAAQGFRFAWASPANGALAALILGPLLLSAYARLRGMTIVATATGCFAGFAAFNAAMLILQFPLASLALPAIDTRLAAIDRMVGSDWPAHFAWVIAAPLRSEVLQSIYQLLLPQILIVCALLAWLDPARLRALVLANTLALGATVLIAALLPSEATFGYYGVSGYSLPMIDQYRAVRDGSLRLLDFASLTGIITFPSYHTILAVLVACAFGGLPRLLPWVAALEAAIVFTTRGVGGHYLADMAAGAVIALLAWIAARRIGRDQAA